MVTEYIEVGIAKTAGMRQLKAAPCLRSEYDGGD